MPVLEYAYRSIPRDVEENKTFYDVKSLSREGRISSNWVLGPAKSETLHAHVQVPYSIIHTSWPFFSRNHKRQMYSTSSLVLQYIVAVPVKEYEYYESEIWSMYVILYLKRNIR